MALVPGGRTALTLLACALGPAAMVAASACGTKAESAPGAHAAGDDAAGGRGGDGGGAPGSDSDAQGAAIDGAGACSDAAAPWTDPGAVAPRADPAAAGVVHHFFKIAVVDQDAGPVVGAALKTTNDVVYTTDRNGNVAYYEPGLMDTDVWFTPTSAGYSLPADGLGNAGKALHPTEGGSGTITMTRSAAVTPPNAGDLQTRLLAASVPGAAQCFAIRAVDSVSARGVPLVAFATSAGDTYWSDSQGFVAYCDPDAIGKSATFTVKSDGYALAQGTSVTVSAVAGGAQTVALVRTLPAERVYRLTGQGIYRDSVLLGMTTPLANPNIDGLVAGQDTPSTIEYAGQVYWIFQDTSRPAYPLGNFASSGAGSARPGAGGDGGLSPDRGVNLTYFVGKDGFSRGMVDTTGDPLLTAGSSSPVWLGQLVGVADGQSQPHVFGKYYVSSSKPWNALAEFDPASSTFRYVADFPAGATVFAGRSNVVDSGAGPYAYWSNPVRFPATVDGVKNIAGYEAFSAYGPNGGTTLAKNADGTLAYAWHAGASVVTHDALVAAHVPLDQELDGHLTDVESGGSVAVANGPGASLFGSVMMWNGTRRRFSAIIQQQYGASLLGESWYAEGDTPLGPWVFTRKVVTHAPSGYTFYNPDVVPYLSEAGGRFVFFDATYTNTYTNVEATPRYNYNEMMYRIDLDDPAMALPVAVYERGTGAASTLVAKQGLRPGDPALAPAFFAYDRAARGAVPVAWDGPSCGNRRLTVGAAPVATPIFYALPADAGDAGQDAGAGLAMIPLYEYAGPNGAYLYSVDPALSVAQYTRGAVIARVWATPIRVALPVADFLGDLVADAGPDQCVHAPGASADVHLDASKTRAPAGDAVQYTWFVPGAACPIATGPTADVVLPAGISEVRLQASDARGNTSSADVVVSVGP